MVALWFILCILTYQNQLHFILVCFPWHIEAPLPYRSIPFPLLLCVMVKYMIPINVTNWTVYCYIYYWTICRHFFSPIQLWSCPPTLYCFLQIYYILQFCIIYMTSNIFYTYYLIQEFLNQLREEMFLYCLS